MAQANGPRFAPKTPVELAPPKKDPVTLEYLSKCDGQNEGYPTCVSIRGILFDVSGNSAYAPGGNYHVFAGKDPSRALGMSSLKDEDCVPDISTLTPEQLETLDGWMSFFKQRYNQVGIIPEYHDSSKEGGTSSS